MAGAVGAIDNTRTPVEKISKRAKTVLQTVLQTRLRTFPASHIRIKNLCGSWHYWTAYTVHINSCQHPWREKEAKTKKI